MGFQVVDRELAVPGTLLDEAKELPVDSDFTLPDYCADIAAVLKCVMRPVIQSKQVTTDRLMADGTALLRVMYLDEGRRCVRTCEFSQPFTCTFTLPAGAAGGQMKLTAATDYINCRATSPRRLDVHGAFTVRLAVTAEGSRRAVADVAGEGIYVRRQPVAFTVPAASAEKVFSIGEMMELGEGKLPAESILRSEVTPVLNELKPLAGKAILKGTLNLRTVYITDGASGATSEAGHEIPFSQIVDVDGLTEGLDCDADLEVLQSDVSASLNQSGDGGLLSVNVKLAANLRCYRTDTAEIVTDAYSSKYPLTLSSEKLEMSQLIGIRRENPVIRETFELPAENLRDVADIWCDLSGVNARCEASGTEPQGSGGHEGTTVEGRMLLCMLVRDDGGEMSYYERADNFSLRVEDTCDHMAVAVKPLKCACAVLPSRQLEVAVTLDMARQCYVTESCMALSEVSADENAAFPAEKAALKIYFAGNGESLWEIAKGCHTSVQAVMDENGLHSDVLAEDTMLLVPMM